MVTTMAIVGNGMTKSWWSRALFGSVLIAGSLLASSPCIAAPPTNWRVGAAFKSQLRQRVGASWEARPFREAVTKLSHQTRMAMMCDRRIDPDQKLTFSSRGEPLSAFLARMAFQQKAGVCNVDSVIYIGPRTLTSKLPTLAAVRELDLDKVSTPVRKRCHKKQPLHWDALSEPRTLIKELGKRYRIRIINVDKTIPHDLWPEGDLPPMSFAKQLTLLTAGFGLTFQFSREGSAVRLVPIPETVVLRHRYMVGRNGVKMVAQFRKDYAKSKFRLRGNQLEVVGPLQDHVAVQRRLRGEPTISRPTRTKIRRQRYSMAAKRAPISAILKKLEEGAELKFHYDPKLAERINHKVPLNVKDVTLDELLKALLGPVNLTYKRDGNQIEILAK